MFVCRFVDHELRVETFFKKDEAKEKKMGTLILKQMI